MSNNHSEAVYALMSPARMIAPGSIADVMEYPPSDRNIEMAKVWATMALAYEQRTANLLSAFLQVTDADECPTFLGERVDPMDIANQIKDRLGLS